MNKYLLLANDQKINQHNHFGLDKFHNLTNSSHSHIFLWVRRGQLRTCALLSTTSNLQTGHLLCRWSCQVVYMKIGLLIIPSWRLDISKKFIDHFITTPSPPNNLVIFSIIDAIAVSVRVLSRLYYIENGNENENITENITGR